MSLLPAALGFPLLVLVVGAIVASSWSLAHVLSPRARFVEVGAATLVLVHLQLLGWFELLGAFRQFGGPLGWLVLASFAAVVVKRFGLPPAPELSSAFRWVRRTPEGFLLLLVLALAAFKAMRGLVAPTMATDAMNYHVPRAVRWVQAGGFSRFGAPDMMEVYDLYPVAGDVSWAWAIALGRSETFVSLFSVASWLEVLFGAYAVARLLDAERVDALGAALLLTCTPAVSVYVGSAYVDTGVLAACVLGLAVLVGFRADPTPSRALLVSLAFALAAAAKASALPLWCAAALVTFLFGVRRASTARVLLAIGLGLLPCVPQMVRLVALRGSPLYPVGLRLFGREIFPWNETFELIVTAKLYGTPKDDPWGFVGKMLTPWLPNMDTTGFGPGFLVVAALAVPGLVRFRRRRDRSLVPVFALVAVMFLGSVWGDHALSYRTGFAVHTARVLTPGLAALVFLGLPVSARWLRLGTAALGLLLSLPHGAAVIDAVAIGPIALCLGATLFVALRLQGRRLVGVGILLWATHLLSLFVRARTRDAYLEAMAAGRVFDVHPNGTYARGVLRVWSAVDRLAPSTIGLAAGWNAEGLNWSMAPLFGPWLAHRIVWVTPTGDGSVIDYRRQDLLGPKLDYAAWRTRLRAAGASWFVTIPPAGVESRFVQQHPEHFAKVVASDSGNYALYRVLEGP